ncbi:MAG: hypothetical protein R3195_10055 [Gemmatimonadota bacterium]|nr:hypothetical protein [Gemmatimonadota bacterium]
MIAVDQSLVLDVENVGTLLLAGKVLSGLAVVGVLAVIVNCWRRDAFPGISYGEIELSHGRLRWLWILFILGGFALGSAEDPVVQAGTTMEDEELLDSAVNRRQTSLDLPLPFYRFERRRVYADGELAVESTTEYFLIPWALLGAFVAYIALVVRWNPENRLALRILQGRGRRWPFRKAKKPEESG